MEFKIGQTVKLVKNHGTKAALGATATILRKYDEFIVIKWKTQHNGQTDGAYFATRFEPVIRKNEQLLFAFMDE